MKSVENPKILLTGGSGRLGTALQGLLPKLIAPPRSELDITHSFFIESALDAYRPDLIVHTAAYTDVAKAETQKELCWNINVGGTRNLIKAVLPRAIPLIHISTDYVFWGDSGGYKEEEPVGPVRNYYALSKLVAEESVRLLPKHLVIRTSFRSSPFPYPVAFDDLYTGQDYLEVIAPEIALALQNFALIPYSTLHILTERKSVYELARRTRPDVEKRSRTSSSVPQPEDISLNVSRWLFLKHSWNTQKVQ